MISVPLTPRVRATARHMVRGMSHKQIADEMGCSVATVNVYAKRILDATGQDNTIAAAVFMIRSAEWLTHIMGKD